MFLCSHPDEYINKRRLKIIQTTKSENVFSDIMADNLSTFKNMMMANRKIMSKELLEETYEHFKRGYSLTVRGFRPFLV